MLVMMIIMITTTNTDIYNNDECDHDDFITMNSLIQILASVGGTVVTCWTDGQQVERSILRQGHDS